MTVISRVHQTCLLVLIATLTTGCQEPLPVAKTSVEAPPVELSSQDEIWATRYDWVPDDTLAGTCGISAPPPEPWKIIRGEGNRAQFHAAAGAFGLVETSDFHSPSPMAYENSVLVTIGKDNLASHVRGVAENTARMIKAGEIAPIAIDRVRKPQTANIAAIADMYTHGRFYVFKARAGNTINNNNSRVDLWLSDDSKETISFDAMNDTHDETPVREYRVTYTKLFDDNIVVEIKSTSQSLIRMRAILRSLEPMIEQCRKEIQPNIQTFWKWRDADRYSASASS